MPKPIADTPPNSPKIRNLELPLAIDSRVPALRVEVVHRGLRGRGRANLLQGTERKRAHVTARVVERPEKLGF